MNNNKVDCLESLLIGIIFLNEIVNVKTKK